MGKGEVKVPLFADDMILAIKDRKTPPENCIWWKHLWVLRYKNITSKLVALLYTNEKCTGKEIIETLPYKIASK